MDSRTFWLVAFVLIGVTGSVLTVARRYRNSDKDAGAGIAAWTAAVLILWVLAGVRLLD